MISSRGYGGMKGGLILSAVCPLIAALSLSFINVIYGDEVTFPDPNLEAAIREALNKPEGPITDEDLAGLTELDASSRGITDLSGIENCLNLQSLYLGDNRISDITPLISLTGLKSLSLSMNLITNIDPLRNLVNLENLSLGSNRIWDLTPLSGLTKLRSLNLWANEISDITPLSSLINLTSKDSSAYWDGRNEMGERVASGVYIYQLRADGKAFARKMVILK